MNSRERKALARRARGEVGPIMRAEITCAACGFEGVAYYKRPPEAFRCGACGKRAALRDDNDPYPPPPEPLPV